MSLLRNPISLQKAELFHSSRRGKVMLVIVAIAFAILVVRLIQLQIFLHSEYAGKSKKNRIIIESLPPIRGTIYDRNNTILAFNQQVFNLVVDSNYRGNLAQLISALALDFDISQQEVEKFYENYFIRNSKISYPIILKADVNTQELMQFSTSLNKYTGAKIISAWQRRYQGNDSVSSVIGYVGRISRNDVTEETKSKFFGLDYIGKQGIEKSQEELLRGKVGFGEYIATSYGNYQSSVNIVYPKRGFDLQLSLDSTLQEFAYLQFNKRAGALVAIDPRNGDILSLVSSPSFNNSHFISRLDPAIYKSYLESNALFNRATSGLYSPASTIKPMLAFGALQQGLIDENEIIDCTGQYFVPNFKYKWYKPFRDWLRSGHGPISMRRAISQSCDIYFYELAYRAKIAGINQSLSWFKFGEQVLSELENERTGVLPNDAWKRQQLREPWLPGDTINVGIGQGYLQVTMLQLANATAIVANRGTWVKPRLIIRKGYRGNVLATQPTQVVRTASTSEKQLFQPVIEGMVEVISKQGTAKDLIGILSIPIASKSGTAQVVQIEKRQGAARAEKKYVDHSLFIAFAPIDNPTIAIACLVENAGKGSGAAGQLVINYLQYYLELYPNGS
ncbi:MAG: penicillin-binding protein 2 [Methylacidiphilales bacterium]|nr:penicillin-binding protein 2 [Candidatus Methylacidiphilales bacterium]